MQMASSRSNSGLCASDTNEFQTLLMLTFATLFLIVCKKKHSIFREIEILEQHVSSGGEKSIVPAVGETSNAQYRFPLLKSLPYTLTQAPSLNECDDLSRSLFSEDAHCFTERGDPQEVSLYIKSVLQIFFPTNSSIIRSAN